MTSGGARRGRRDNGLVAAAYAVVGDVDPRVGEHLLDVLGLRGIAAYLQPASDLHPVTRTTTLPSRPTDRLFVDSEHVETARAYLAELGPEAPSSDEPERPGEVAEPDVDELFAGIVAAYHEDATEVTWPASEDVPTDDPEARDDGPAPTRTTPLPRWRRSTVTPRWAGPVSPGEELAEEDDDEGYTPPPPPPLPRFAPVTILAVLAILAGVVLLFNPGLLPTDTTVAMTIGFCGILAGFVTLIWRLRSGDDDEEDPDDGAVV